MDWKKILPWPVVSGVVLLMFPVAAQFTPTEVLTKLGTWKCIALGLVSFTFIVGLVRAAYLLGFSKGSAATSPVDDVPFAGGIVAVAGLPEPERETKADEQSIDGLKYLVREIRDLLLERGKLQTDRVKTHLIRLKREHPAWHNETAHRERTAFLKAASDGLRIRMADDNKTGDFTDEQRKGYGGLITQRARLLQQALDEART